VEGRPILIVAVSACAAAAGCGASDRESDAAAVAERFHAAIEQRAGGAACEELSEDARGRLEQQERKPCEEAILGLELPRGGTAARTVVYVTTASVSLAEGGTTFLDEFDQGWKVSAAGCVPTAPDQPYECELEG
jgi:hypothetical protein